MTLTDRLPAYFRLNAINADTSDETINRHVGLLFDYRNHHEQHRELRMTPQTAWDAAIRDGRSKLRPVPKEPWWHYVWASRYQANVASDGCVCFRNDRFPTQMPHGSKVVLCDHHDRTISILKKEPSKHELPVILFTNRPG